MMLVTATVKVKELANGKVKAKTDARSVTRATGLHRPMGVAKLERATSVSAVQTYLSAQKAASLSSVLAF